MSLAQLKGEAARLQPSEERELIAFLVSWQTEQDKAFRAGLTRKIDDNDPAHWVELGELQRLYSQ